MINPIILMLVKKIEQKSHCTVSLTISLLTVAILTGGTGCARFGDYVQHRADMAAYRVITETQTKALGETKAFALTPAKTKAFDALTDHAKHLNLADTAFANPTYALSLTDAVAIALAKNRQYLTRKEALYTQALELTGVRWDYGFIFNASGSAAHRRTESTENNTSVSSGTDPSASTNGVESTSTKDSSKSTSLEKLQSDLALINNLVSALPQNKKTKNVEYFGSNQITTGVKRRLATGAQISLGYTHDFVQQLTNGGTPESNNNLAINMVQPLLRGAGNLVAREELHQSERNMIYSVRDFALYEQDFVINIAADYFALLSVLDKMNNAHANYTSAAANYDLMQIQLRHRICSQLQVDQARQKVLDAEALWIDTQATYQSQLDQFKQFLGVDLALDLGPDQHELDRLSQSGMVQPDLTLDQAIETALAQRLDYRNVHDQRDDAKRHINVARRGFLPSLNLRYNLLFTGKQHYGFGFDSVNRTGAWELDLGLPLDWTSRRNTYRLTMIELDQMHRNMESCHNQVIIDVREQWRQLDRLKRRVDIAQQSVALAKRRVEGTQMMLAAGQTTAREMANVQDELLNAQNNLTSDLIGYTMNRLKFWRAIGRLEISNVVEPLQNRIN